MNIIEQFIIAAATSYMLDVDSGIIRRPDNTIDVELWTAAWHLWGQYGSRDF